MIRKNKRGHEETYFPGKHLKFCDLRAQIQNRYFSTFPPNFPYPTEFHVSEVRHDTNLGGFQAILSDFGFKEPGTGLVWWSAAVSKDDIAAAEWRFIQRQRVDNGGKLFLHKFTSSPAFQKSSRLGNFRFTFPLSVLLEAYAEQFCMGQVPQMRTYETVVYKQEVMYVLVIHSPDVQREFERYPLLKDHSAAPCALKDGKIVWRPEGPSKTHAFRLTPGSRQLVKKVPRKKRRFYMWDHVVLAFHVPQEKIFRFDEETLLSHLSLCQGANPKLNTEEFVKCEFEAGLQIQ